MPERDTEPRDSERVRDSEHTTVIHSDRDGGGGGGMIVALVLLVLLAALLFFLFGGGLGGGDEGDVNVNVDAPELTVPDVEIPDVNVTLPEPAEEGGNDSAQ